MDGGVYMGWKVVKRVSSGQLLYWYRASMLVLRKHKRSEGRHGTEPITYARLVF